MSVIAFHQIKNTGDGKELGETIIRLLGRVRINNWEVCIMRMNRLASVVHSAIIDWDSYAQRDVRE